MRFAKVIRAHGTFSEALQVPEHEVWCRKEGLSSCFFVFIWMMGWQSHLINKSLILAQFGNDWQW